MLERRANNSAVPAGVPVGMPEDRARAKAHARRNNERRYRHTTRGRYTRHKANAKQRGVDFHLTFEEWIAIWKLSGHWSEKNNRPHRGFCMCRHADEGAYEVGNVRIGTKGQNARERNAWYEKAPERADPLDETTDGFDY